MNISKVKSPCMGCDQRRLHCHSECSNYISYLKANEAIRRQKWEQIAINDTLYAGETRRIRSFVRTKAAGLKHKGFRYNGSR